MESENVLVVGGCGFVGSHVVDALVRRNTNKVVVMDNLFLGKMENLNWAKKNGNLVVYREDARYVTALENIMKREKVDSVINLAVKCLPYGFIDPEGAYMTGVEIALNLANLLRKECYTRLLHFSSSEAFGTAQTVPMDESHPWKPSSPYAAGKASADHLLLSFYNLFNSPISIIRPFNMYGPRQNMDAYAAVIPITINRILHGKAPILEGDGEQTRDLTYVEDVAEACLNLFNTDTCIGKVINVGSGKEVKIKDLIETICVLMDFPISRVRNHVARIADVRRLCASNKLANKLFGYKPTTDFNTGLQLTIEWYRLQVNDEV